MLSEPARNCGLVELFDGPSRVDPAENSKSVATGAESAPQSHR